MNVMLPLGPETHRHEIVPLESFVHLLVRFRTKDFENWRRYLTVVMSTMPTEQVSAVTSWISPASHCGIVEITCRAQDAIAMRNGASMQPGVIQSYLSLSKCQFYAHPQQIQK